ncbi:hypothetical protein [Algoriphagus sanaruensis]|uniref:Uncharacterized protein n=1 Tax=Algoriphagus sanaruensis TaxID=1727163 RepID=A0A142EM59_9BACT|nr:hypothetical protein [Algoriphagus sanaruensis]AMQ56214.1 hypothetical protein AO498_07290 [Algoriphagus sanaruensis]
MDNFQIELAEKIFEKAKETGGLPDLMYAQNILTIDQQNDPRIIKDVEMVIKLLVYQGLLNSEPKRSSNYITPSPLSLKFKSYQDFLENQAQNAEKLKRKEEQEEQKFNLEIENLQLQIIHQRQWLWKTLAAAILVELVQFYFIFIEK